MNRKQLDEILTKHGLKVDNFSGGAGLFRDLYIGTGADLSILQRARDEINEAFVNNGCPNMRAVIDHVDVSKHPDYGKPFVLIKSFWDE